MNIALMSHDHKKELMVQFCIAYCGVLSKHTVCATNTTGRLVAEATGLPVRLFLSHAHGGSQQIGARIAYNEIDMVLFFSDPQSSDLDPDLKYINQMCDQYNIPFATNAATAEILIHGLERGDLASCSPMGTRWARCWTGTACARFNLLSISSKKVDFFFKMRDTLTCIVGEKLEPRYFRKGAEEGKRYTVDDMQFNAVAVALKS